MNIITNEAETKKIYCEYCSGKWRISSIFYEGEKRIKKQYARVSEVTYDEKNKVILLRDDLKVPYTYIRTIFAENAFLDKEKYPKTNEKYNLSSIFFYIDMSGNVISPVYIDATDTFYEMDSRIPLDDETYADFIEKLTKEIIEILINRSITRQKQLLKGGRIYENTKC